jgi:hypothetical protein
METRPFIIDDNLRKKIASLVTHAEKNPFTMDDLLDIKNGREKPAGDYDEFTLNLPFGYRIVYSIEEQPKGKIRHLSMSVNEDEKLPNEFVVREVMKLIGFKNELENCEVFLESISLSRQAVNVLEIIEADK